MKSITADIKGLLIQSKLSKKAGYKRANSFCPLRESKESVRDDGSVFINDICYSEKYPNSFFDVFYPHKERAQSYLRLFIFTAADTYSEAKHKEIRLQLRPPEKA